MCDHKLRLDSFNFSSRTCSDCHKELLEENKRLTEERDALQKRVDEFTIYSNELYAALSEDEIPPKEVVLSKRNLLALLSKVEREGSARTIIKPDGTVVRAETDEEHYGNREFPPGVMHPIEEQNIREDPLGMKYWPGKESQA